MKKIFEFNKNMVIFVADKKEMAINNTIKSKVVGEEVYINHYTVCNNALKKVFKIDSDLLIREELDKNLNTLLVEVFMTDDRYKKGEFVTICSLLSKRLLKMVG